MIGSFGCAVRVVSGLARPRAGPAGGAPGSIQEVPPPARSRAAVVVVIIIAIAPPFERRHPGRLRGSRAADQLLELTAIEPDAAATITSVDGHAIAIQLDEGCVLASGTGHMHSFAPTMTILLIQGNRRFLHGSCEISKPPNDDANS
jgi:hypothetical protein